ncbi:hypothetical protein [Methylobacterium sp. CM6257]
MAAAVTGDAKSFTADLGLISWAGAWPELFREIVRVGFVHPSARAAFCEAWCGSDDMVSGSDILAKRMGWSLTRDFAGQPDLLVAGLRLLMPETAVTRPVYALFRGQSLAEHQAGRHGCWWTPEPVHAELFALMPNRTRSGPGAVVVAFAPEDAIITALNRTEFLIDSRRLENIMLVAELPPRRLADGEDPLRASQLIGIPSGYSFEDLDAWLAAGFSGSGLAA